MKKQIYTAVMETLGQNGIQDVSIETLNSDDLKQVNRFFKKELLPILSPILIGPNHPVPHLVNKRMNAVAMLKNKKGERAVGIVPVPAHVSPYLLLEDGMRYVRTENILLHWLPALFDAYTVKESCNEDDFRRQMKKLLKQRDHLSVVRLELSTQVSSDFQKLLSGIARVEKYQIFVDSTPLNMGYVFKLVGDLPKELSTRLLYPTYRPRWAEDLKHDQPIMPQVLSF